MWREAPRNLPEWSLAVAQSSLHHKIQCGPGDNPPSYPGDIIRSFYGDKVVGTDHSLPTSTQVKNGTILPCSQYSA